jgi:hypothetical protein
MPDRKYVYRIEVDASSAGPSAAQARRAIERELSNVRFAPQIQPQAARAMPSFAPSRSGGGGGFSGNLTPGMDISTLTGLSIGGYAVTEMVRATLEAGKLGAENLRLARSFDQLAQGAGLAGDVLAQKLSAATQQTVTEQKLMADTNMLLAAAQGEQIKITEDQIATLAQFARLRSTQLTANGRPLSTQEAYQRLIQGTVKRETELLDELGLSTKAMADQLGVPVQEINKDVESLLSAITKVAEIEIARFGEPIIDEATRIEQAATRIENAKGRIDAALAGPTAWAYEAGANVTEWVQRQISPNLQDSRNTLQGNVDFANKMSIGDFGYKQLPNIKENAELVNFIDRVNGAMKNGVPVSDSFMKSLEGVAEQAASTGVMTDQSREQLDRLVTSFNMGSGSAYNMYGALEDTEIAMTDAERAAARLAESQANLNAQFAEAQQLLRVMYNGQTFVNLPQVGLMPEQGPQLPGADYLNQRSIIAGGGFVSPGGNNIDDLLDSATEGGIERRNQAYEESVREQERLQAQAIRTHEADQRESVQRIERAWLDGAEAFRNTVESIPGIMGTSQVTAEQMELAKLGIPQNFADNKRRRLEDEVLNGVDWGDIDPAAMFARAGIDPALDPKAQMALFNQKWADSSLFSDPANLEFFDQEAIRAEMDRQRMSEMGRSNILGAFGLGEDGEGAYFKDLGSIMQNGMMAGAEEGLASFGTDAIGNVMMQLKSDAALTEYANLGAAMFDATWEGYVNQVGGSNLVGAITAEVLRQLNDAMP